VVLERFDLPEVLRLLGDEGITELFVVPPVMLALANSPEVEPAQFQGLRFLLSAAAPLAPEVRAVDASRAGPAPQLLNEIPAHSVRRLQNRLVRYDLTADELRHPRPQRLLLGGRLELNAAGCRPSSLRLSHLLHFKRLLSAGAFFI